MDEAVSKFRGGPQGQSLSQLAQANFGESFAWRELIAPFVANRHGQFTKAKNIFMPVSD